MQIVQLVAIVGSLIAVIILRIFIRKALLDLPNEQKLLIVDITSKNNLWYMLAFCVPVALLLLNANYHWVSDEKAVMFFSIIMVLLFASRLFNFYKKFKESQINESYTKKYLIYYIAIIFIVIIYLSIVFFKQIF